jgi:hypothetical protein
MKWLVRTPVQIGGFSLLILPGKRQMGAEVFFIYTEAKA